MRQTCITFIIVFARRKFNKKKNISTQSDEKSLQVKKFSELQHPKAKWKKKPNKAEKTKQ